MLKMAEKNKLKLRTYYDRDEQTKELKRFSKVYKRSTSSIVRDGIELILERLRDKSL